MSIKEYGCACGKNHINPVHKIIKGKGALKGLCDEVKAYKAKKAFVLCDKTTYSVAGERVCTQLKESGIQHTCFVIDSKMPQPDEKSVGSVIMNYDALSDIVIGVGSGVINDIGKIVSATAKVPYIIVATAPSMDGYASATSSMENAGVKVTIASKCPDVIIGDTDILKNAPMRMLKSGLGDMIAKYVSICEWRIANIITGEYYCEEIALLVRKAVKLCTDNAVGLLHRDEKAVEAVFDGLVIGGIAMAYAGASRPASGIEHYLSHIWDMRGLEFGTKTDFHGIQCAVGTLEAVKLYERLKKTVPDREKAISYVENFDYNEWKEKLMQFVGTGAESMIALEEKERKYDVSKHKERLEIIISNWDKILTVIKEELPCKNDLQKLFKTLDMPCDCEDIGIDREILTMTFKASKDIRDKYVLSRLSWDLGIIDEIV